MRHAPILILILPIALPMALSSAALASGTPYTTAYDAPFAGFPGIGFPPNPSIPNENFAIARNETLGIEIGLQAGIRFGGEVANIDERYTAPAGFAPTSLTNPAPSRNAAWNINWGVILPNAFRNWDIDLRVDFDPAAAQQEWITLDFNALLDGLGLPAVLSAQNMGAAFWQAPQYGAPDFDPAAPGEYDIDLTVRDLSGAIVARSAIVVQVVPAPAPAALLGPGPLLAARRRR